MAYWTFAYLKDSDNVVRQMGNVSVVDPDDPEVLMAYDNFPAQNMAQLPVERPGRIRNIVGATNGVLKLHIAFPEAVTIDLLSLVGHNLSSSATVTVYGGSSFDPSTNLGTITWQRRTMFKLFSSGQSYRYWTVTIDDAACEDGYVQIGYLVMGTVTSLSFGYQDMDYSTEEVSTKYVTDSGTRLSGHLTGRRRLVLNFRNVSNSEADTLHALYTSCVGKQEKLFVIPNTDDDEAFFGSFDQDSFVRSFVTHTIESTSWVFSEDNVGRSIPQPLAFLSAGERLPGDWTFTRSTTARYKNAELALVEAAANELRSKHYQDYGVYGMLIEANTHINYCLQSEDFTTTWTKSDANMTVTPNATNEPLATPTGNADKIIEATAGAGSIQHYMQQSFTGLTASARHSIGVFVKAEERTRCRLELYAASGPHGFYMNVQGLDTATPSVTLAAGIGSGTVIGYDIERYKDGWWRLQISGTVSTATSASIICMILNDAGSSTYTGDGASGLYFWGADFGKNNYDFPLSYIPTTTGTATCEPDALYKLLPGDEKYGPITIYADMVETGWPKYTDNYESIAWLGDVQGGDTGQIRAYHSTVLAMVTDEGTNTAVDTATISAAIGARYEFLGHLQPDGYTRVWRYDSSGSNDGGGSVSAIDWNLLEAYNFEAVSVGYSYAGTAYKGFWLIKALKIVRGNQDIATMRAL